MKNRYYLLTVVVAALLTTTFVSVTPANAQYAGLEADFGIPSDETRDLGWGGQLRAGAGAPIPLLRLDVESAFDYSRFPDAAVDDAWGVWRLVGGLRVGLDVPVVPYAVAHIGYGRYSSPTATGQDGAGGLTWDAGLASDIISLSIVDLGLHATYKSLAADSEAVGEPLRWFGLGVHGQFNF